MQPKNVRPRISNCSHNFLEFLSELLDLKKLKLTHPFLLCAVGYVEHSCSILLRRMQTTATNFGLTVRSSIRYNVNKFE